MVFKTKILPVILFTASLFVFFGGAREVKAACDILDANIRHGVIVQNPNGDSDDDDESNFQEAFIDDGEPPYVYFDIKTTGCLDADDDMDIEVSLTEDDWGVNDDVNSIPELDDFDIDVPSDDFTIAYLAGEDECQSSGEPDCEYHIETWDDVGEDGQEWDNLDYSCDVICDTNWVFKGYLPYGEIHLEDDIGVTLDQVNGGVGITSTDYLAPLPGLAGQPSTLKGFLQGLFQVLIIIAGILAVIMIVLGAITYLSTDAIGGKSDGIAMMRDAVLGLVLALGAWIIINTINPNLAATLGITIPQTSIRVLEGDSGVYSNVATGAPGGGTNTANQLPTDIGLYCPGSGGSAAIPAIIDSFEKKVAYRWGGKGGALPPGASYPLSPSEQPPKNPYMCKNDAGQTVPCNTFCPGGNVCLDCSGFINHVRACAGLPTYQTNTQGMTNAPNAEPVDMSQLNGSGTIIGSYTLVPGDILVWNGHVVVYYGGGKIAESSGGSAGRQKDGNIVIASTKKYKKKITHIIKVQ